MAYIKVSDKKAKDFANSLMIRNEYEPEVWFFRVEIIQQSYDTLFFPVDVFLMVDKKLIHENKLYEETEESYRK